MQPIRSYKSPHFHKNPISVEFVVIHYTAQNLTRSLDIFLHPHSKVSCHLMIDEDGLLYELVSCWDGCSYRAFHAGESFWVDSSGQKWLNFNDFSIGIELVNPNGNIFHYSEKQYQSLIQVLNHLKNQYPALNNSARILGHEHIARHRNKSDPGYLFDWDRLLKAVYNQKKASHLLPLLTKKQQKSLSFIPSTLNQDQYRKISLILEKKLPFWFKILLIKFILFYRK